MTGPCKEAGFTLIEAVMVIVILGIITSGLLMYFTGVSSSGGPPLNIQGAMLAEEKLERVIAGKKANGFSTIVSEPSAPLPAPFNRFTMQLDVFCVQEADLNSSNGTMPGCADSDIRAKRVRAVVSWPGGSVDVATVITSH